MPLSGTLAVTLFPLLMAYAAFSDLFTMTISNWIAILLVVGFLVLAFVTGMAPATLLGLHLAPGLGVLALTFVFFARGWIGGGDAKLAAATALWLGGDHLADYGLLASVLGTVLTVGLLVLRKRALPAALCHRPWVARLHAAGTGVPYGIALAIAGLLIYPDTALWQAAIRL